MPELTALMFVAPTISRCRARLVEPEAKRRAQEAFRGRVLKERVVARFDDHRPAALASAGHARSRQLG